MKRLLIIASCALFAALSSQATVLVNEDFGTYSDGNIDGVNGWLASTNGMTNLVVGGELMLDPNGDRIMFSSAGADLMAGDSVQITVDYRLGVQSVRRHSGHFGFGIQTNDTGVAAGNEELINTYVFSFGLEPSFRLDGQVNHFPDNQQWQGPGTFELTSEDYGMNPHGYYTNEAPYDSASFVDAESDVMRGIYTITKSHIANQFDVMIATSNLTTGVSGSGSDSGIVRTNAWDSSNLYLTLYSSDNGNTNYIQSVQMETFPPALLPPTTVSALGLDGEVQVTWTAMAGATQYDVYRDGGFLANVSTEAYTDAAVVNGNTYSYTVVAKYYNGDSVQSGASEATPNNISSDGVILDTDFTGYPNGDLASNSADWSELGGSSNNAFSVITDGPDQKIDTAVVSNSFDNVVGNGVYYDSLVRNDADDAIEGYFDVVISVTANGTNDADHTHQTLMTFGLTTSTEESHHLTSKDMMALLSLKIRHENRLLVMFGDDSITENNSLSIINFGDLGWNPKPNAGQSWVGTPGAIDLETDPLRVSWKIRKTRDEGVYQAWASVSNMTSNVSYENAEFITLSREGLYDSAAALFSMSHYYTANLDGRFSTLHATVNEMKVTHTVGNTPAVLDPTITAVLAADREVTISWEDVLEATGYSLDVETPEGEVYSVLSESASTSVADGPRWNDIANDYTLTVHYDSDLVPDTTTTNFSAAPIGLVPAYQNSESWGTGTVQVDESTRVTNGAVYYYDYLTTPMWENGVGGYTGPSVHSYLIGAKPELTASTQGNKVYSGLPTSGWDTWPYATSLCFIEVADMGGGETSYDTTEGPMNIYGRWAGWSAGNNGDGGVNGHRMAIRNGTDWYVSNEYVSNAGGGGITREVLVADVANSMWMPLTVIVGNEPTRGAAVDGSTLNLTDVNAIGWYHNRMWSTGFYELEVKVSGAQPSYFYWADSQGLVSTNNAPELDPDEDGIENEREYAMGGDPLTPDTATLPVAQVVGAPGSENIQYIYKKQRDPQSGINYVLKSTTDLVNGDGNSNYGVWSTNNHSSTEGVDDYYWMNVTNDVPYGSGVGTTFIDLEIQ